ncbi:MAG: hypothetical protein CM15mV8_2320 [Caudoviricetes sp.]|nr:MAG: hypothetical protein CM15mV8_2320 [Caudoviricetes sp.]
MALLQTILEYTLQKAFRDTLQTTNKVYMFVGRAKLGEDVPPTGELLIVSSMRELLTVTLLHLSVLDISDTALVVPRVDWVDPTKTTGGVGRYSMYKPDYAPTKLRKRFF